MKLMLAYDGSAGAEDALDDLQRAGLPPQVEALLLTVADVFLPPDDGQAQLAGPIPTAVRNAWAHAQRALQDAQRLAEQGGARLRARFPAWYVQVESCADNPAWALVKRADAWQPQLLVVGSHGYSPWHRFVLGSVSQKVVTEARCAVRVARRRTRVGEAPVRLLLGIDGSADADTVVRAVATRSWPSGSAARIVMALDARTITHLVATHPTHQGQPTSGTPDIHALAQARLAEAETLLHAAGLAVTMCIQEGDPKHLLLDEAQQWEAESIFVGARGLSRIERFMLGSVSTAITARAPCSVEVIRSAPLAG